MTYTTTDIVSDPTYTSSLISQEATSTEPATTPISSTIFTSESTTLSIPTSETTTIETTVYSSPMTSTTTEIVSSPNYSSSLSQQTTTETAASPISSTISTSDSITESTSTIETTSYSSPMTSTTTDIVSDPTYTSSLTSQEAISTDSATTLMSSTIFTPESTTVSIPTSETTTTETTSYPSPSTDIESSLNFSLSYQQTTTTAPPTMPIENTTLLTEPSTIGEMLNSTTEEILTIPVTNSSSTTMDSSSISHVPPFSTAGTSQSILSTSIPASNASISTEFTTEITIGTAGCEPLPKPDYGVVKYNPNYTEVGSQATLKCDDGFKAGGLESKLCFGNGYWHPPNITFQCVRKDCGNITNPTNGVIEYKPNTLFGSTAILRCSDGFKAASLRSKLCLASGNWTDADKTFQCNMIECNELKNPHNGKVLHNNRTVNSTANYTCDATFQLSGFSQRKCLFNGHWSGSEPECKKVTANVPNCARDTDDRNTTWGEARPGQVVVKECTNGTQGIISRLCTETGHWSPPVYNCIRQALIDLNDTVNAISENPNEEVVSSALDSLSDLTSTSNSERINEGELESVTNMLASIANVSNTRKEINVTQDQAKSFLETTSNLLDTSNLKSWQSIEQDTSNKNERRGADKVLQVIDIYTAAIAKSLGSGGNTNVSTKNMVLFVSAKEEGQHIEFPPEGLQKVLNSSSGFRLPANAVEGVDSYSSVFYRNLSGVLPSRPANQGDTKQDLNSAVLSINVIVNGSDSTQLRENISITMEHLNVDNEDSLRPQCSFWNFSENGWSQRGCYSKFSNQSTTVCECNHLTNFAILMSPFTENNVNSKAIDIITIVGCSISIVGLIITMVLHVALWRYLKADRVVILMNLSVALVLSYIIFLAGVNRTENKDVCTTVAVLLQYIYLVVFFLMLAEGVEIGFIVLYVFSIRSRIKWTLPLAWGIPAAIVGISLGATQLEGYGTQKYCWLSITNGVIWAFVGPALLIILINFVLLVLILRAMLRTRSLAMKSNIERTKSGLRCICIMLPLVGCTWVLGVFYVDEDVSWIQYLFAVCNSLQGFVIFVFHCALNSQIKMAIRKRRRRYSDVSFGKKPFSSSKPLSIHLVTSRTTSSEDVYLKSASTSKHFYDGPMDTDAPDADQLGMKHLNIEHWNPASSNADQWSPKLSNREHWNPTYPSNYLLSYRHEAGRKDENTRESAFF